MLSYASFFPQLTFILALVSMCMNVCYRRKKTNKVASKIPLRSGVPEPSKSAAGTIIPDVDIDKKLTPSAQLLPPGSDVAVEPIWTDKISVKSHVKSSKSQDIQVPKLKSLPEPKSKKKEGKSRMQTSIPVPKEKSKKQPSKKVELSKADASEPARTPPSESVEVRTDPTQKSRSSLTEDDDDTCKNADSLREDLEKSKSSKRDKTRKKKKQS